MEYKTTNKQRTYSEAYYYTNKKRDREKRKLRHRAWYKRNSEKKKAYNKAYVAAHREEKKAERRKNLDRDRIYCQNRRALKYQTQIEYISAKIVYMRDGWKCQICHEKVNKKLKYPDPMSPSLDHIVPLNKGGKHIYANVQLVHWLCNMSKGTRILPQGEQMRIF